MKLKKYIKFKKTSNLDFAKKISVSPVSLSRYISGDRFPEKQILIKIFKETEGLVTPNDFVFSENEKNKFKNNEEDLTKFIKKIRSGSKRYLARAITLVESSLRSDQKFSQQLLQKFKIKNNSIRVGITGVPGVGKSTFIENFGMKLINLGYKVAVLAVDPSSKMSGGSILGDKTRMEKLSINPNAFIRPSPSGGHLGGVAMKSYESLMCLEEAGYNFIFVETMGVGQAETAVHDMVDIFLVLLLPSGGDELQGIKKGIIEMADLIVINKADGELKKSAEITQREYKNATFFNTKPRSGDDLEVFTCSSFTEEGFEKILNFLLKFIEKRKKSEDFYYNRDDQRIKWMWNIVDLKIKEFVNINLYNKNFLDKILIEVKKNKLSAYKASEIISNIILKK